MAELHLRPNESFEQVYEREPRALAFRAETLAEWQLWRDRARGKLVKLLGLPATRGDLRPEILEEYPREGYRVQKIALQTQPYVTALAYVLLPDGDPGPRPVVLALHGHGSGARGILNEPINQEHTQEIQLYNYNYAQIAAQRGYVVIAPEQIGFAERREASEIASGISASSCRQLAYWAQMLGRTTVGLRVWDALRCLDYLETRPEADCSRAAILGLSGGGTTTLFTAALDERFRAAVVSGYLCQWRGCLLAMEHCECNYVPGILRYLECGDLGALIAPRALLVEAGRQDPIFPLPYVREAYATVERAYALLGVPERLDRDEFEGEHRWSGAKAWDFLARCLD